MDYVQNQWEIVVPDVQALESNITDTNTLVTNVGAFEVQSISDLDNAFTTNGVTSFSLADIATEMAGVSLIVTNFYNAMPRKFQIFLYAVFFFGVATMILTVGSKVVKKVGD